MQLLQDLRPSLQLFVQSRRTSMSGSLVDRCRACSYPVQGCSCDVAVISGAKQNGIKENAVRISESPYLLPFFPSLLA